jgi:hypothetical protein
VVVGLLHSRMPPAGKKAVMSLFTERRDGRAGQLSTIEVGVDVPTASLMVIEHAERFWPVATAPTPRPGRARRNVDLRCCIRPATRPAGLRWRGRGF